MTEPDDWPSRLQAAVAETLRKRAERRDLRRQLDERRAYGLAQRQRQKLALNRQGETVPDVPPCCAEAAEPPCDQHRQAARVARHQGPRNRHAGASVYAGPPEGDARGTRVTPRGSRGTGRGRGDEVAS